jgi:type I restriction enzyme S subunit
MDWKKEKFKTLTQHKSGYTWSKEQETKIPEPNTVRVLTVTNIQKELDLSSELYLKGVSDIDKIKKAVSKEWSIAVSSNGNRKRIGNAVYIKEDSEYLFASFLTAFKPKEDADILPEYFFRWLSSHKIQERITSVSEGTTGLGNLDIRYLRNMGIEYPENPNEQTAIATILSKVDEAIEATRQSIKAAEKLKKALMQNLLTGKLKPDGTWRNDGEFYEDEKFGKVPVGWEVKKINELVNRKNDTIDPLKSKVVFDYIGLEHIAPGEFIRIGKGKSNETLAIKVTFEKGDLLYGKLRPYLNKVWLADISGVGSTEFLVFERNNFIDWIYLNFQTKRFLNFTLSMTAGTQHPRASWRDIKRFIVIKPIDDDEMKTISNKILSTENDKKQKQTKIKTLQCLKKSLMQNLLTGKVRVDVEAIHKIISEQNNG